MPNSSPAVQLRTLRRDPPLSPGASLPRRLWHAWQRAGRAVGMLLSRVVTTLLYFVAVTPFAIGAKLGSDPLELRRRAPRWTPLPPPGGIEDARRGL